MAWPSAIRHSKSANRHFQSAEWRSKSAEWHFSCAKWQAAPPSYFHATLHSQTFFQAHLTLKKFFFQVKLGHSNMPNSFVLKNHHLHHCFQKQVKSSFVFFFLPETHEFMFQTRGIRPYLIHFQKRPPSSFFFFFKIIIIKISKKSCIHFKLRGFGFASFK